MSEFTEQDIPARMERLMVLQGYRPDGTLVERLSVTRVTARDGSVEVLTMSINPNHPNRYTQSWTYDDPHQAINDALVRLGWGELVEMGKDEET